MKLKKLIRLEKYTFTKYSAVLIAIFLFALSLRLYLAFQTSHFSNDAYFNLREIENIKETGVPFLYDDLSFGGRAINFLPMFHYIIAFFSLFMPTWIAAKIIPNVMASSLVFIMYYIAKHMIKRRDGALFAAFISAFIPIFFYKTLNNVSELSLVIPLLFLAFYFFLRLKEDKKYSTYYVITLFFLVLAHQTIIILILGLLLYWLFIKLENLPTNKAELEIILFSVFLVIWINFIAFKRALLFHGHYVVWQNIPLEILDNYFTNINVLEAVYQIGVIPFALGIYIIYKTLFKEKKIQIFILIAFSMAVAFLLWLKLIRPEIGLIYLGAVLTLLFSYYYVSFSNLIDKSNIHRYKSFLIFLLIALFALTSIYPSVHYGLEEIGRAPSKNEIAALDWLESNSVPQDVILSAPEDGNLISYYATRKNVIDNNYLLVNDARQRYIDVTDIFTTLYSVDANQLLNKYEVKYIYISRSAEREFGVSDLKYAEKNCFSLVYSSDDVKVYKPLCKITETI
ncbi:MAG: glycosyltransferase family 39 protein [Nanoarchaeota archaeon]|nr:glycosyltransferase family 39 protein [Nanoarchaeota archaeon]